MVRLRYLAWVMHRYCLHALTGVHLSRAFFQSTWNGAKRSLTQSSWILRNRPWYSRLSSLPWRECSRPDRRSWWREALLRYKCKRDISLGKRSKKYFHHPGPTTNFSVIQTNDDDCFISFLFLFFLYWWKATACAKSYCLVMHILCLQEILYFMSYCFISSSTLSPATAHYLLVP